jgi:outer membrane protein assembly factor BamB
MTPLSSDTAEWISVLPVAYKDCVLFTRSTFASERDTLKLLDKKTGKIKWTWADYFNNTGIHQLKIFLQNEKLIFTTWDAVYCVNVQNGTTVWRTQIEKSNGHPRISVLNNNVYHVHLLRSNNSTYTSYLVQASINIGKWDTIYSQPRIDNFEPNIEPPTTSWKNEKNQEIIFFQIRYTDFKAIGTSKPYGRIDWVAYNLNTKKEEYRLNDIDRGRIGNVLNAIQTVDKVYFLCINSLFCINKKDGSILWQKNFDKSETFTATSPFIAQNILFIKPDIDILFALDPNTGNQIWVDNKNGSGAHDMVYFDGLIYYTCDGDAKILAIEPSTGKKIWSEYSPSRYKNKFNGNRVFSNANIGFGGIAIDSTLGYLYSSDFYFAMCLKLPKK